MKIKSTSVRILKPDAAPLAALPRLVVAVVGREAAPRERQEAVRRSGTQGAQALLRELQR